MFSDGTPLTAMDVATSLMRTNELNNAAQSSIGTLTMTPTSDGKITIITTIATPLMSSVLAEWAFVVYKTTEEGNRIFTGPRRLGHKPRTAATPPRALSVPPPPHISLPHHGWQARTPS